ncbi:leucine--tRNA ligase [Candidatus Uhrbacteria bacterium]|jgi:leucyl-tRNA synthetase|nr:leucine--tRNA ligase [Candidatus Uhrbacteria bacterium]MBT7717077.1 leucine--tRNA ligase [Candidatus Uhrbacteria bacterium]
MNYDHNKIEKKWQKRWMDSGVFEAKDDSDKPREYLLIEFPYPSGAGLHIGHPRSYTALDVIARKKRMEGKNVLYPIGWDAFGLPTENFAIKHGRKPQEVTKENTDTFRRQLQSLGFSFDWSREINTTDPEYYKWTQWIFMQMFKHGLAYKDKVAINWCINCKIGLANEEVVGGACERCGGEVEKRSKEQWMLRITQYADRLIDDLKSLDYIEPVKTQQKNWIGRSEGASIKFSLPDVVEEEYGPEHAQNFLEVFTTRPDTVFGATYMVIAPEHDMIEKYADQIENIKEIRDYIRQAGKKSDFERADAGKEKTGVELKGMQALNPLTDERISIWVADYVMAGYGTGAIMAVPAHDERDFEFATKFGIKIVDVVEPQEKVEGCFAGEGTAVNSDFLNGLSTVEAKKKITDWLESYGIGSAKVQYKLRDWVFSRQRYWGEPIPMVHCENCKTKSKYGDGWLPLPESELPLTLPEVDKYEPTDTGESPLSKIEDWVNTECPECGGPAKRETDVMPNWAGSSWYFMRYAAPKSDEMFGVNNWKRTEIQPDELDHRLFDLFEHMQSLLGEHDVSIWASGSLMINGINKELWRHMHDLDLFVLGSDFDKALKILRDDGFVVHEEDRGWNRIEKDGCQVELVPAYHLSGDVYTHLRDKSLPPEIRQQTLHKQDMELSDRGFLWGTSFKTLSPKSMLEHYEFLHETFPDTREGKEDDEKIKFLQDYLKSPLNYWAPVTWYNGGMEHTTLHLLYSRFWNKFLFDIGAAPTNEPYEKRTSHGLILAEDGHKMSKSKGNVVNPDEIVEKFGADALRIYEMFMGPFEEPVPWNMNGLVGAKRFLDKIVGLSGVFVDAEPDDVTRELHKTIKKVTEDIENMRFNTAVAQMMIFVNKCKESGAVTKESFEKFLRILCPFAPHLANELADQLGYDGMLEAGEWPKYDAELVVDEVVNIAVQINGKLRGEVQAAPDASQDEVERLARADTNAAKYLEGDIKKVIYVPGRLINFVV